MRSLLRWAVIASALLAPAASLAAPGRFYIVGMGVSPDLVTVRGLNVIKKADLFLLQDRSEADYWKEYVGGKEVIIVPHSARVGLGLDSSKVASPQLKAALAQHEKERAEAIAKIREAVAAGKNVVSLQSGDPMMYGTTYFLEMLPKDFPAEVVPGIGAFQAASAAVKRSPVFGYDTNSVILTMGDWPGRADTNEQLMATGTSLVVYTMHLDYAEFFGLLKKHYPADTPVAVVCSAGDPEKERVLQSTVGKFLTEVDTARLPKESNLLLVGKFLTCGQARKDALLGMK